LAPKKHYGKRKLIGTLVQVKNALHDNVLFKFYTVFI
jgi:hypothetical protein